MDQNDFLRTELQYLPEYQEFRGRRKKGALFALFVCAIEYCFLAISTQRAIQKGFTLAKWEWIGLAIVIPLALYTIVLLTRAIFYAFLKKPDFITNGVIKDIKRNINKTDQDTCTETWYLVSNGSDQEYWGKCVTSYDKESDDEYEESHAIGDRVLYFTMGKEKWIVSA